MQPNSTASESVRERLLRDLGAIRTLLDDPRMGGQVLERLPNGEYAWLRPELDAAIADADQVHERLTRLLERRPEPQPQPDEPRVALTQRGRVLLARWRAEVALFGREVSA